MIDNSPLTGESAAIRLTAQMQEKSLEECGNIGFAGCTVVKGTGRGVVFATGLRTRFGRIAQLSQTIRRTGSPLEREISRMIRILTTIACTMGFSFFLYGVMSGKPLWMNLVFMMGIIVANVPEGLLPTLTLALVMGSLRMAKKNVLVTSLNAVEALGAVHVICTDKTGTLTLNQLTITRMVEPHTGAAMTPEREQRTGHPGPGRLRCPAVRGAVARRSPGCGGGQQMAQPGAGATGGCAAAGGALLCL